jgi:hypothetical protein
VHESQVQGDVDQPGDAGHQQGCPRVLEAPQHPHGGQYHEHRRHAEQADPQVRDGVGCRVGRGAERLDHQRSQRYAEDGDRYADGRGQPQAVNALRQRIPQIPAA